MFNTRQTFEKITLKDSLIGALAWAGLMLALRLVALLLVGLWMLMVGPWGGVVLLALVAVALQRLSLAQTAQPDGTLTWGYSLSFHQARWQQHREMWLWLLVAGALFSALMLADVWLGMRWLTEEGHTYLFIGTWMWQVPPLVVWGRWLFVVAMPWVCADPLTLLYWTARTEQRTPKAREVGFAAASIDSVPDERGQPLAARAATARANREPAPEFEGVYPPTPVAARVLDNQDMLP